jgi:IS30 family transposase
MGKKYSHLSLEEREILYGLKEQGKSFREIADLLGRSHTTLSREYRRHAKYGKQYLPCKAHQKALKNEQEQRIKAPLKNVKVFLYVREKLRRNWSPETISGRLSIDHPGESICPETIYQYIYGKGKTFKLWRFLTKSHKRRRVKSGRKLKLKKSSRIPGAVSIDNRPGKVKKRKQAGHFETDLMEGNRKEKTVLSVNVERKTRYTLLKKMKNKKAKTKSKTMLKDLKMLKSLQKSRKPIVRSITADNGSENTKHTRISRSLKAKFYFCHAYASWEKGTVENTIGRIRDYIPKGTSLAMYTNQQIQWLENQLNNTPRKCLNYLTPNEAMEQEVNKYKFRKYQQQKEASGALRGRM